MAHSKEKEMSQLSVELPTDGQLIEKLQAGDLEALGILYERHKNLVYRTALAVVQDPSVAEDILQESFLRLNRYARRVDTSLPLEPWLYRVTVNQAYSWETRRRRWQIPLDGVIDYLVSPKSHSPEWRTELNQVRSEVMEALHSLSVNQRIVIVLHYLNSLSLKEIADVLDCPVGTVKSRLYYGRENLLRKLEGGRKVTPEMVYEFI
jgi:RNA polymerase sigma-70 factor (ECF subfamily)